MDSFDHLEDTDLDALFAELGVEFEEEPESTGPGRARALALDYQPGSTTLPGFSFDYWATVNRELTPAEAQARVDDRRRRAERIARMTPEELAEFRARNAARDRARFANLTAEQRERRNALARFYYRRDKPKKAKPVVNLTPKQAAAEEARRKWRREYDRKRYLELKAKKAKGSV